MNEEKDIVKALKETKEVIDVAVGIIKMYRKYFEENAMSDSTSNPVHNKSAKQVQPETNHQENLNPPLPCLLTYTKEEFLRDLQYHKIDIDRASYLNDAFRSGKTVLKFSRENIINQIKHSHVILPEYKMVEAIEFFDIGDADVE